MRHATRTNPRKRTKTKRREGPTGDTEHLPARLRAIVATTFDQKPKRIKSRPNKTAKSNKRKKNTSRNRDRRPNKTAKSNKRKKNTSHNRDRNPPLLSYEQLKSQIESLVDQQYNNDGGGMRQIHITPHY